MAKFSKKTTSILFLLAALFIALFLGSYNYLIIKKQVIDLPIVHEGITNEPVEITKPENPTQ